MKTVMVEDIRWVEDLKGREQTTFSSEGDGNLKYSRVRKEESLRVPSESEWPGERNSCGQYVKRSEFFG